MIRRRCIRRRKLLDDLKDRWRYSHLKEEALDRTMWRNRFGGGFGPGVRQNTEWWWIKFLVNKTNRCTEFQFYWCYYCTCFGQPFCPSSGVLSCTSALVHFMELWPFAARSRFPTPGSKRSQLHKNVGWNSTPGSKRSQLHKKCRMESHSWQQTVTTT